MFAVCYLEWIYLRPRSPTNACGKVTNTTQRINEQGHTCATWSRSISEHVGINGRRSAYMNVFLPKFLVQTLRKRAKRKLAGRKCRRGGIAAQRGGGASEEERAAFASASSSFSSMACPWNAVIASCANAKAALTFASVTLSTSSSVICKKGFHMPKPAL